MLLRDEFLNPLRYYKPKCRMLLILAASTGCRIAELLGLEIADVLDDCTTVRVVQQAKGPEITPQLKTVNSAVLWTYAQR
jgi:integrase